MAAFCADRRTSPTAYHARRTTITSLVSASTVPPIVIRVYQILSVHLARVDSPLSVISVSEIASFLA